jgi:hypothetical protein
MHNNIAMVFFKKTLHIQEHSRTFKNIQEHSRTFKNIQEHSRRGIQEPGSSIPEADATAPRRQGSFFNMYTFELFDQSLTFGFFNSVNEIK